MAAGVGDSAGYVKRNRGKKTPEHNEYSHLIRQQLQEQNPPLELVYWKAAPGAGARSLTAALGTLHEFLVNKNYVSCTTYISSVSYVSYVSHEVGGWLFLCRV